MLISRKQGIERITEILTASGLFTPDEIRMVWDYFDWNSDEALKLGYRDLDGVKKGFWRSSFGLSVMRCLPQQ